LVTSSFIESFISQTIYYLKFIATRISPYFRVSNFRVTKILSLKQSIISNLLRQESHHIFE